MSEIFEIINGNSQKQAQAEHIWQQTRQMEKDIKRREAEEALQQARIRKANTEMNLHTLCTAILVFATWVSVHSHLINPVLGASMAVILSMAFAIHAGAWIQYRFCGKEGVLGGRP